MASIKDMKHLANFLFAPNYYAKQAKPPRKVYDARKLTEEDRLELLAIVTDAVRPEKLTCNFQLTGETLRLKTEMLEGAKRALERYNK